MDFNVANSPAVVESSSRNAVASANLLSGNLLIVPAKACPRFRPANNTRAHKALLPLELIPE
ncbi:hypothetical protein [Paeniglutamicibacter sp. NPDC091659]|uniref:hypothetical protein n=1 Tax=Paeniglutamicibacter sp. NPDC091659 TaxID=3364389 RepID=UPI0037F2F3C8